MVDPGLPLAAVCGSTPGDPNAEIKRKPSFLFTKVTHPSRDRPDDPPTSFIQGRSCDLFSRATSANCTVTCMILVAQRRDPRPRPRHREIETPAALAFWI
jgi:hypothetical protein